MDELELSEELEDFMNTNFNSIKSRVIRECLDYANIFSKYDLGKAISTEKLNETLDDLINETESTGKDETIISVELMIFNTLILWLEKIGIVLDRDIIIDSGSKFSRIKDIYLTLINIIEPETQTAKFILQCIEADYEDDIERLSDIIAEGIPNANSLHYYEIITEVNEQLFEVLKNNAELVIFKSNSEIDNNLIAVINKLISTDKKYLNTCIVKEVMNFERGPETMVKNVQFAFNYIINNKLTSDEVPYELVAAIMLCDEYPNLQDAVEFAEEINLDPLAKNIPQALLNTTRSITVELIQKLY